MHARGLRGIWVLAWLVSLAACGSEDSGGRSNTGGAGGTVDAGNDAAGATGGTAGTAPGGSGGLGGTSGASTGGNAGAGTGGNAGASAQYLSAKQLTSPSVSMNCMPSIPADPVAVSVTATYQNQSTSPGLVDVRGELEWTTPAALSWDFDLDPSTLTVPAGATQDVTHTKVAGSGKAVAGTGMPCDYCNTEGTLRLLYKTGAGASLLIATAKVIPLCSY